jgi:hypothetical protein
MAQRHPGQILYLSNPIGARLGAHPLQTLLAAGTDPGMAACGAPGWSRRRPSASRSTRTSTPPSSATPQALPPAFAWRLQPAARPIGGRRGHLPLTFDLARLDSHDSCTRPVHGCGPAQICRGAPAHHLLSAYDEDLDVGVGH